VFRCCTTDAADRPVAAPIHTAGLLQPGIRQILHQQAEAPLGTQTLSTIVDIEAKEIVVLNYAEKTAQIHTADKVPPVPEGFVMPKFDASLKRTGQTRLIAGARCEEHVFAMSVSMAEMAASPKMPAEAAEMLKDMRMIMNGSLWVAKSGPGVAEYVAFQTASAKQSMAAAIRAIPGMGSSGFDRLIESFSGAAGLPYLTEMTMVIEGGGELAPMLKQLGEMKMTSRVTEVSTEPLADDLFKVPADYKITRSSSVPALAGAERRP
jgi:hypothetical protein